MAAQSRAQATVDELESGLQETARVVRGGTPGERELRAIDAIAAQAAES